MIDYDERLQFLEMFCDADKCLYSYYRTGLWKDSITDAKSRGWSLKKINGAWCHFCPLHNPWEERNGQIH